MPTLTRPAAFWLVGGVLALFMAAAAAPSPLYVVYQSELGFSALTLTLVFGVYSLALLVALVTVGSVSDHVGRRPVLVGALLAGAAAMVLFLLPAATGWLLAARSLQGLATGAVLGAVSATLVDLAPPGNPRLAAMVTSTATSGGLVLGALGAGLLVEYAPGPTRTVFVVLLVAFVLLAVGVLAVGETVEKMVGAWASLRPVISFPSRIRPQVLALLPCLVATWALGGFYLSLGPSVAASVLGVSNHLVGGAVIAALNVPGVAAALWLRDADAHRAMSGGSTVFALGVGATVGGVALGSTWGFLLGTGVAGLGFGAAILGVFRVLGELADPRERAGLFAAAYVMSYLAYSAPAVVAGLAVTQVGLRTTALGFGGTVAALAVLSLLLSGRTRTRGVVAGSPG
ncbi:MAG: MFS transporter [Mycobacteriaceae bacterium]